MNIYLVCKHRTFRDNYGTGVLKDFTIHSHWNRKYLAQDVSYDLNKRSKKYWYSIKKLVVTV